MTNHALDLEKKIFQKEVIQRIIENNATDKKRPWVIELDPTTACNLACHDCISANLLNQGGFPRERLNELAKEFYKNGVKAVVLIGGGEPMAHPEFGNIINYFYENDIHVGVTSNGTMIKKYLQILANKTKWVRISVDAGTEKVFQDYRPHASGKSQFNSVIGQMTELSSIKKCRLGYSFLILNKFNKDGSFQDTNSTDIINAAKIAKEIGCDYFEVKPSFDMMHYLSKFPDETIKIVNEQLIKIKELETEKFTIISPFTLEDSLKNQTIQEKSYTKCPTTEYRAVFTQSGAFVCPYHRGNNNLKIGDPVNQSFSEIWHGATRANVMNKLNPKEHCKFHCIRHKTNLELEKINKDISKVNISENFDRFI